MELVTNIYEANCITHSGTMHADEVFSTAFLDLFLGKIKLYRATSIPDDINDDVLIYDIGRGQFDHHQEDAKKRENGIPYCSFGLLWQAFGKAFLEQRNTKDIEDVFTMIDKDLIEGIDADDNGIFFKTEASYKIKTISDTIKLFNPSYKSNQDENEQFLKAVTVAKEILLQEILNITGKVIAKQKVLEKLTEKTNHTLYLDEYMPYEHTILSEESANDIYFVVFPSNRGGYAIKTVPKSQEDHNKRLDFPKEWAGLEQQELEKVAGIKGLKFCHATRFLVSCDTMETAKKVINKALTQQETENENTLDKNN